jgi:hypothetical protein
MKSGIILENDDLKKIIARHFGVKESNVIKAKYHWMVAGAQPMNEKVEEDNKDFSLLNI